MLVIRLARGGRHKYPTYRIVAAESARAATGKFVEILGHYNPHTKEIMIKKEETEARLKNGAQPSNTVAKLLQQEKIELPKWVEVKTRNLKPKKEPVEKEVKAEAPVADEAPAEEVAAPEAAEPAESTDTKNEAAKETAAETPKEKPAEDETRVAEAATDNAAETEEKGPEPDTTETAEITEKAADAAAATEEAGEEAPADKSDDAK